MKLNIFKKEEKTKKNSKKSEAALDLKKQEVESKAESSKNDINYVSGAHQIIKSFYVSEKASNLINFNQYVFIVGKRANKTEIGKNIEKVFNVKVKDIKIINMPSKTRNVGRFSGTKSGFKKAIVVLKPGHTIEQAKA